MNESDLQRLIVEWCSWSLPDDVLYFSIPNEHTSKAQTGRLKGMGMLPGVADLQFVRQHDDGWPVVLFLEVKLPARKPTDTQRAFADRAVAAGAFYEVARSLEDAQEALERLGFRR